MKDYRLSEMAGIDLENIWHFIAEDDPHAASKYIQGFLDLFKLLAATPKMGRLRPDLRVGARSHPRGPYVIVYGEKADYAKVLRIVHGARNLKKALRGKGFGE